MKKLGFIVEGLMEKQIIQEVCEGQPVRTFNNGRDVAPRALAKQAATLIKLMKHANPVIIVFDREKRPESCQELTESFLEAIEEYNISRERVIVGVADRMIENWILACSAARQRYGITFETEGCHGKHKLSEILNKSGKHYHERTIGVELFLAIDKYSAMRNSISFKLFAEALAPHCR